MFCRSCGSPLSDGARFCTKCGAQAFPNVQNAAQQPQSAAKKFRQSYQQGKQKGQNAFGKKAAKSAAKTGAKAGLGSVAKAALVTTVGIAVIGGASTLLNNGEGGGGDNGDRPGYEETYNPNGVDGTYTSNSTGTSQNTGDYTGGGYTSAQEGQNFTRFWMATAGFPTEDGEPDLNVLFRPESFYIVERDAASGKAYFWAHKREGEPDMIHGYDPNTGTITLIDEDDPGNVGYLYENEDGSYTYGVTQIVEVENGSVRAGVYYKMTGLTSDDGENWTVPATGESFQWSEFGNTSAMSDSRAMNQFKEDAKAWAIANGVTLQYKEPEQEQPAYTPPPSSIGKIDPPEDVLQYYVQVEAQHRISEQAGYPNGHVTLPENWNITQEQFDAMVEQEMRGQIMTP